MGLCYDIAFIFLYENIYPEKCDFNAIIQIVSIKEEKEYCNKYIGKVKKSNIEKTKDTKVILYIDSKEDLLPGDIININGDFTKPNKSRNYKGFNYYNYLKIQKIYGSIIVEKYEKIGSYNNFNIIIEKIRLNCINQIDILYNVKYGEFLKGILIGKCDGIDEYIKNNFRDSNISHILAISGLHVSFIILGIEYVINKILNNKKIKDIIILIFLFIYMFFTGCTASCMRSCIMVSMKVLASIIYRKNNIYMSIFLSFFILIMINPFNIFNIGMWLSFAGTLGIVMFSKFLSRIIQLKYKKNKVIIYLLNIIIVSISAQILIFPIMIYCFNTYSLSFFIPNLLISFLISPILILGYISILLSYMKIPFVEFFVNFENFLIFIILKIAEICKNIPLSKIYIITPPFILIIGYYVGIAILIQLFIKRKIYFLKIIISYNFLKKEIIKKINIEKIIKILLIFILINFCVKFFNNDLKIYFIDVGQGDCTVIQTPKGKNIIIDGGEGNSGKYDYGEKVVFPYLLDRKIKHIDYLIISHCDSDHIGGLFYVLENIKVENVLIGIQFENSEQFENLIKIINDKKIDIVFLESGDKIKIENGLEIHVLWPNKENVIQDNVLNNNSLVFKLVYNNKMSALFTGDIEEYAEKAILELYSNNLEILKSDILKVAHHGSKTSSNEIFLLNVEPQIGLIGVGENNKFEHPHDEVIYRFQKKGIEIFRTDKNGEIEIIVNKDYEIKINKHIIK